MTCVYRYEFGLDVPLDDVESALLLAIWGTESLHGESQARLDIGHLLRREQRACVIDASTAVGRDLNRLFVGYLRREFGEDSFCVKRVQESMSGQLAEAAV